MDVNGLPFRLVTGARDFGFAADAAGAKVAAHLALSETNGHLRLASEQAAPSEAEHEIFARGLASQPSPVADPLGGFAWWNDAVTPKRIDASGFAPGATEIALDAGDDDSPQGKALKAVAGISPSDMMLGEDDVLYVARNGTVTWHDLRDRWRDMAVSHASYKADLLAPAPGGGGWAFDRTNRRLLRIKGTPLRFTGLRDPGIAEFGPIEPNRNPPRMIEAKGRIDARFDAIALACSPGGKLALLAWESGKDAAVFTYGEKGFAQHGRLKGLRFPFSLSWIGEDEVAVLAASSAAALAPQSYTYALTGAAVADRELLPQGGIRPLRSPWAGGFCNALGAVPRHLTIETADAPPTGIRPLHALSGGHYAREGRVLIGPIDGAGAGCAWHRIYAEAALADGSAIDLQLHASDAAADPAMPTGLDDPDWALHRLLPHRRADTPAGAPTAAWLPQPSEIANAPAMLACEARADKAGLFTLLVQHSGRKVRRVTGRYLWIALTLRGDSQTTPELAALRIYAHRLSWRDRYLPAFYGETLSGSDGEAQGPATRHDFMERFLHGHEGALTELEGRIAGSWQLTDPATAPGPALPWIGGWIGVPATPGEATARIRQRLLAAPHTARLSGTAGGLMAALELATGGRMIAGGRLDPGQIGSGRRVPAPGELAVARAGDVAVRGLMLTTRADGDCVFLTGGSVTRGDIVVVEGFRLRRTFATILGADLADEDDPLTLGMATSGNSFVGDTLILGDPLILEGGARDELLALYRPEIDASRRDTDAVAAFYARLAWRVLVLVRGVTDPSEFKRLKDVVEAEIPAHVEPQVLHARNPLIVGAASLIGLDTYLAEPEPFERVRLGETPMTGSMLGAGDFVAGSGRLDARADGPIPGPPVARADGPGEVWVGSDFTLSALASRAAEQRRINRYIWMWDKET